jgi:hypothetical protein
VASGLSAFIFGSEPARFESDFDLAESIERLRAATTRSVFLSLHKESASGTVNEHRVSLQRVIPMVGNSFKPFFVGAFEVVNGRVVLAGRFTMIWFAKAFMTFWFGFILLWTVLAGVSVIAHPQAGQWQLPLFGLGMAAVGVAMVRAGKWFARNDVAWLSERIQAALSAGAPKHEPAPKAA